MSLIDNLASIFKPDAKRIALEKREAERERRAQGYSRSEAKKSVARAFAKNGRRGGRNKP